MSTLATTLTRQLEANAAEREAAELERQAVARKRFRELVERDATPEPGDDVLLTNTLEVLGLTLDDYRDHVKALALMKNYASRHKTMAEDQELRDQLRAFERETAVKLGEVAATVFAAGPAWGGGQFLRQLIASCFWLDSREIVSATSRVDAALFAFGEAESAHRLTMQYTNVGPAMGQLRVDYPLIFSTT